MKLGRFQRGVTEKGVLACQYIVSPALPDRQPCCHTTATSHPLLKDDHIAPESRLRVQCWCIASRQHGIVIPVATQMSLPLFVYPLLKPAGYETVALVENCWI